MMDSNSMSRLEFDGVTKKNKQLFRLGIGGLIIGVLLVAAGGTMLGIGIHKNNKKTPECPATTLATQPPTSVSTVSLTSSPTTPTTPQSTRNVFILLDASQDIAGGDFQTMKDYVATAVVPFLPINVGTTFKAATSTNVAVLSYSKDSITIHDFYDVTDIATLQNQIANIPQSSSSSGISKAVSLTNQLLPMGNSPNLMMVMGSGNQQDLQNSVTNIQQLKTSATSVQWIALGKANKLDFSQITNFTNFYGSNGYELSNDDTKKLLQQLNPNNLTPPPPTIPIVNPPTCTNDVVILIDESLATKSTVVFNAELSFLTNILVNSWTVNTQSIEALAISYSLESATELSVSPFAYTSVDGLKTDINKKKGNVPVFRPSVTAGLSFAQSSLNGRRPNMNLTTLLITYSSNFDDIVTAIPEANTIGGQLVILAVGDQIVMDNLYYLSGTVLRTSPLFEGDIANQINQAICASPISPSPLPQTIPTTSAVPVTVTTPIVPTTLLTGPTTTAPSTLPPTTTINPSDYKPCLSDIVFVQDMSNSFTGDAFRTATLTLTSNFIIQSFWNHYERFGLAAYATNQSSIMNFGTFSTRNDFTNAVQSLQVYSSPTSLTQGLSRIEAGFATSTFAQNTIFYISKVDLNDLQTAIPVANRIGLKGKLILVGVSPLVTKEDLQPLVNDNTISFVFDPLTTLGWDLLARRIRDSLICDPSTYSSTTPTTTPFTGPTTTFIYTVASTTTPNQYVPCQSSVSFTSFVYQGLSLADFATQQTFISNVIGQMNHPERIQYIEGNTDIVNWGNDESIATIQGDVQLSTQRNEKFLMRYVLAALWGLVQSTPPMAPVGTLVFIPTNLDPTSYGGGQSFANNLKNANVKLTFVLMGPDMDQSLLTNYTNSFIHWRNLNNPQPDDWNDNFMSAYNCPAATSPATGVTTTTAMPTVPTTSVSPTTVLTTTAPPTTVVTTTAPPTTVPTTLPTTTLTPYKPCKSWISFSADKSNGLSSPNDFTTQLAFISSSIGRLNHPERLQYGTGAGTDIVWGSRSSIADIQSAVTSSEQMPDPFNLRKVLQVLYTAFTSAQDGNVVQSPTAAIVFVSDTRTPQNYNGADQFSKMLTDAGVKLTFVLMSNNVDQTLLTNFTTNFVTWRNLNNPEPDDWNDSFVYNCPF